MEFLGHDPAGCTSVPTEGTPAGTLTDSITAAHEGMLSKGSVNPCGTPVRGAWSRHESRRSSGDAAGAGSREPPGRCGWRRAARAWEGTQRDRSGGKGRAGGALRMIGKGKQLQEHGDNLNITIMYIIIYLLYDIHISNTSYLFLYICIKGSGRKL